MPRSLAVFLLSLAVFGTVAFVLPIGPFGDEPHYLLIADSLVRDRDINLVNQYDSALAASIGVGRDGAHANEYPDENTLAPGHAIGVSVLVAPGYALAGWRGAMAVLVILSALVAVEVEALARSMLLGTTSAGALRIRGVGVPARPSSQPAGDLRSTGRPATIGGLSAGGDAHPTGPPHAVRSAPTKVAEVNEGPDGAAYRAGWASLVATALVLFTPPFVLSAGRLFPEVPAALAVVLVLRRAVAGGWGGRWVVCGALVALPWIGVKFAALAVVLIGILFLSGRWWRSGSAALLLSLLLIEAFLWRFYGSLNPNVLYYGAGIDLAGMPNGLVGQLIDQEFGLLIGGPVAFVGLIALFVQLRRPVVAAIGVLVAVAWMVGASHPLWWGGLSFTPRYLLPVLPLLAVPIVRWLMPATVAAVPAVAVLVVGLVSPILLLNIGTREHRMLLAAGPMGRQVASVWPSFVAARGDWYSAPLTPGEGNDVVRIGPRVWRRGTAEIRVRSTGSGTLRIQAVAGDRRAPLLEMPVSAPETTVRFTYPGATFLDADAEILITVTGSITVEDLAWRG